jgi:hypothetical protein
MPTEAIEAERDDAWQPEPPLTFQAAKKVAESNQNQPRNAMPRIGTMARLMVQVSSSPRRAGPGCWRR